MSADAPVVLVTGATGPLGRVAVKRFAADGARLALAGTNRARLAAVAAEAGLSGRGLAAGRSATSAIATPHAPWSPPSTTRFGRVDVLLHLIGGWAGGTAVVDLDAGEITLDARPAPVDDLPPGAGGGPRHGRSAGSVGS